MPSHNEKSFEGDVWVAEDVLELECRPVEESLFLRPQQVAEGAFSVSHTDSTWLACTPDGVAISSLPEQQERLDATLSTNDLQLIGPPYSQILEDGTVRPCAPVESKAAGEYEGLDTELLPATDLMSIFSLQDYDGSSSLVDRLRAEAQRRDLISTGPVRLVRYDHDGMGLTGELVVELQIPVEMAQLQ